FSFAAQHLRVEHLHIVLEGSHLRARRELRMCAGQVLGRARRAFRSSGQPWLERSGSANVGFVRTDGGFDSGASMPAVSGRVQHVETNLLAGEKIREVAGGARIRAMA